MTADRRAALVRKVCRAICQEENGPCDEPICVAENGCTFWTPHAVAAIDLIRAEVLEEAEDAVGEVGDCAEVGAYINAIRALKETPCSSS
jgi:hypothetical protein